MLLALCSLKGSPGVTTLAVALAARWPIEEQPILVEADPAGGDLMARFCLHESPGLVSMAAAARRSTDQALLAEHVQVLRGGLQVVVGPVGAEQTRAALSAVDDSSPLLRFAGLPGRTVIADCGRADPDSPALPIIRGADAMLLLARPLDEELAHVALKLSTAQRWSSRPGFVLIGDGHRTHEVSRALGIPVMAHVPQDDKGAAVLNGKGNGRHGPARSRLGRAAAQLARLIHGQWQTAGNGGSPLMQHRAPVSGHTPDGTALQPLGPTGNGPRS
ncbi:chromosome partitioning protein [Saccharothrix saharensis]|uniref:chromosome partitioning protein n=1 Tax=Saccharothrix saharensis TaxID=571190 RepID=UPI0036AC98ED